MPDVVTAPIRRATPLDALYEAVRELADLSDPAVVCERVVTLLPTWLDANEGALALWNARTGTLEVVAAAGAAMVRTIGQRCDPSSVLGRSFTDGVSMRVDDYRTFMDVDPSGVARGVRCVASAPLLTRDGPFGALIVQRCGDSGQAFREDDMRMLTVVAALVTAASAARGEPPAKRAPDPRGRDNSRLAPLSPLDTNARFRLQGLTSATASLGSDLNDAAVMERAITAFAEFVETDAVTFFEMSYAGEWQVLQATESARRRRQANISFVPLLDTVRERQPLFIEDTDDPPAELDSPPVRAMRENGTRALLALPFSGRDGRLCVLAAYAREPRHWVAEELLAARHFGFHVETALENARLHQSVGEVAAQLQFVLESAGAIIFSYDLEGRFTQASGAFERLLGYRLEELLTFSVFDLIAPGDRDVVAKHVQGRVEGGDSAAYELDVKTKQGTTVPLMIRSVALRDAEGSVTGGTGLCIDVSMRKDLEQRLIEGEKLRALGQLAAGVAHDVNNSLAAIIGPSELLLESLRQGVASAGELLTDLTMIRQAATDAAAIVRRLQIFARASGEQSLVRKEPIAPYHLLHDVAAMTRPRWRDQALREGRHITLRTEASETMPTFLAEPAQLREVLTNLVHNAIDALPNGGSITLSAETGHDAVVLRVKDTGTGMTPDVRKRLFEPFFTTKDVGNGTGLGLATSYGIVRSLGGTIDVDTKPKRGTTMIVTLPLARDDITRTPAPRATITKSLRILFVEDERVLRDIGERLLRREGHAVVSAATAEEALERYQPGRFDLVLTDVGLPGVSGHVLIARIKALDPRQCIGIASGWGASLNEVDLELAGITHDLIASKPYRLDDLRRLLAAAASTHYR